ncbi:MAG: 2-phospho-L-lactate transferase [Phototrophicaceae bacterium]
MALITDKNIVVLVGGVGGAKLALGLQQVVAPENLTIVVNTGDDFWHYGLKICPDIDTVLYTLSGRVNKDFGWGVADDTSITLDALKTIGETPWFLLGDKDMATHLLRLHMLRQGFSLTEIVQHLAKAMGIQATILPMTDTEVPTIVDTVEHGELEFQEYFVKHRWQPTVKNLQFRNIESSSISEAIQQALLSADAIIVGPSNPWLSIAPILAVPTMRDTLLGLDVPRIAVTPIVEGKAIKGPAAKLMAELGYEVSAQSVADYYGDVITAFIYDERDKDFESYGLNSIAFDTIMNTDEDKARLSRQILNWVFQMEAV